MAQALFNRKAMEMGVEATAFSRGICADGSDISDNAAMVLCEVGISGFCHVSRTVSEDDVRDADFVIGISSRHAAHLISEFPQYCDKIYAFPFDVSDPFGGNIDVYRKTLSEISKGIDIIIREVFPECQ